MEPNTNKRFSRRFLIGVFILIILMLAAAGLGIAYRVNEFNKLRRLADRSAELEVAVMHVAAAPANEEIVLPGNVTAWHEAILNARVDGYVRKWMVDIGARVRAGELLALISAPELDAQLRQSKAELKTAQANYHIAHTTALRWRHLLKTDSVSKQETEEKLSTEKATAATVNSARANRDRLKDLVNYKRVVAPFDGVIMSRNTDVGRLINAGNGTTPLFRLVQVNRLRVYIKIPQYYSTFIGRDFTAQLHFNEHPGRTFTAKLLDTAQAIDPNTRTLLAQFVLENADYQLLAGGYTQAHLIIPSQMNAVRLPVNTLIFRAQGMQVAQIDEHHQVVLKPITIGRDFGDSVEVVAGLNAGEIVILNPPDAIFNGQKVRVVKTV